MDTRSKASAEVDLSFACMFARELTGTGPGGGLLHLDEALGGALTALRRDGTFHGGFMETLLLDRPPATVAAKAIAVIGLGDPSAWTPDATARAAAAALRIALQRGVSSAAFAPGLLDAGLVLGKDEVAPAMLKAVAAAMDAQAHGVERGLAVPSPLRRWVFDVGAAHFDATAGLFRSAFATLDADAAP